MAGPIASTYWWNDEIERAEEWFVFFKLPADRYQELAAFLVEKHSYDEPEILATAFVLIYLSGEFLIFKRFSPVALTDVVEAVGAGGFAAVGVAAVIMGLPYLKNYLPLGSTPGAVSSAFRPLICRSIPLARSVTVSMPCARRLRGDDTKEWRVSVDGRCSTPARCFWRFSCLIFPAISTAPISMSPSLPGCATKRCSRQQTIWCVR